MEAKYKAGEGDFSSISIEKEKEIVTALSKISNYFDEGHTFDQCLYDSMKWYDHDTEMIQISKDFPDVYFVLYGEGEERDDNWVKFYHNGESECCMARITYERPDDKDFYDLIGFWNWED
jgi:hypothetical protein